MTRMKGESYLRCTNCQREIRLSRSVRIDGGHQCRSCAEETRLELRYMRTSSN